MGAGTGGWACVSLPTNCCFGITAHVRSSELIRALRRDGWQQVAQKESHIGFKHPGKPGRVTVPHPERDIPVGTLRSIERQSGVKLR